MSARWMVFNVGCIECGVSSDIVGFFDSQELAHAVADECQNMFDWREGGQNAFVVFDVMAGRSREYKEAIDRAIVQDFLAGEDK